MKVNFHEKDFNKIYLSYINNTERFLVFYGGGGSGKSVFIAQRFLYLCLKEKYFRLLFSRKIAKTIRNSSFQLFKDLIISGGLQALFNIKESTMEIICINGNQMIAVGMDDPEKIKSIAEPSHAWLEEATEYSKNDIMQVSTRLRTRKARFNQIVLSFNPVSTEHWIYESLFLKDEFKSIKIKSTYLDNRFIPKQYKDELESYKYIDENYYKVYALGEWGGQIKGAIYTKYELKDFPDGCEIIYGLDFGFNHPTAFIKVGIKENNIYVQQLIYKRGLTNSDLIEELKSLNIGRGQIYADAAEPQRIEEIYRAGFNIHDADKSKDSVRKGIDKIKSMSFFINPDSQDILKEIRNYKWKEDRMGKLENEPVKLFDDALDAIRYAVHTHIKEGDEPIHIFCP